MNETSDKLWRFRGNQSLTIESINFEANRFSLLGDSSLDITDISVNDTGTYFCINGSKVYAIYDIHVSSDEERMFACDKSCNKFPNCQKSKDDDTYGDRNIKIFNNFTNWSNCNRCGKPGIRRQIGICTIKV